MQAGKILKEAKNAQNILFHHLQEHLIELLNRANHREYTITKLVQYEVFRYCGRTPSTR